MTQFGSLALIDMGQDEDDTGKNIRLPGVRKGNHSSRHFKPELLVTCVRFSPTGKRISDILIYLFTFEI
jgi:periodic tryptophan protein 2